MVRTEHYGDLLLIVVLKQQHTQDLILVVVMKNQSTKKDHSLVQYLNCAKCKPVFTAHFFCPEDTE
jgi:hypothetical protein